MPLLLILALLLVLLMHSVMQQLIRSLRLWQLAPSQLVAVPAPLLLKQVAAVGAASLLSKQTMLVAVGPALVGMREVVPMTVVEVVDPRTTSLQGQEQLLELLLLCIMAFELLVEET